MTQEQERMLAHELVLNKLKELIGQVMSFVKDGHSKHSVIFFPSFCVYCEFLENMLIPPDELGLVFAKVCELAHRLRHDGEVAPDCFLRRMEELRININEYCKEIN